MAIQYKPVGRTVRIPAVTDLHINNFNNGLINIHGSYIKNGVIRKYPTGQYYVTQRPGVAITETPADGSVTDLRGRGAFYWAQVGALYFVNNDTVYKTNYSTDLTSLMSEGTQRVDIAELGDVIVFLDSENNEMWHIHSSASTTVDTMASYTTTRTDISFTAPSQMNTVAGDFSALEAGDRFTVTTDSGTNDGTYTVVTAVAATITVAETTISTEAAAPAGTVTIMSFGALPQNNSLTLAAGLVVLDQTMYVLDTQGTVWGSAIGNALDWTDALNYITAEKEEDAGVAISKHYDHVVVFGTRTIEFMYDAGNPTGSPLISTRRYLV